MDTKLSDLPPLKRLLMQQKQQNNTNLDLNESYVPVKKRKEARNIVLNESSFSYVPMKKRKEARNIDLNEPKVSYVPMKKRKEAKNIDTNESKASFLPMKKRVWAFRPDEIDLNVEYKDCFGSPEKPNIFIESPKNLVIKSLVKPKNTIENFEKPKSTIESLKTPMIESLVKPKNTTESTKNPIESVENPLIESAIIPKLPFEIPKKPRSQTQVVKKLNQIESLEKLNAMMERSEKPKPDIESLKNTNSPIEILNTLNPTIEKSKKTDPFVKKSKKHSKKPIFCIESMKKTNSPIEILNTLNPTIEKSKKTDPFVKKSKKHSKKPIFCIESMKKTNLSTKILKTQNPNIDIPKKVNSDVEIPKTQNILNKPNPLAKCAKKPNLSIETSKKPVISPKKLIKSPKKHTETQYDDEEDGIICNICDSTDGDPLDPIVFCDGCDLMVHSSCYGYPLIENIPEGDWFCSQCEFLKIFEKNDTVFSPNSEKREKIEQNGAFSCSLCPNTSEEIQKDDKIFKICENADENCVFSCIQCQNIEKIKKNDTLSGKKNKKNSVITCALCPKIGGAMKQTTDKKWAHIVCSLLVPEVFFREFEKREKIDCSKVPKRRYEKTCYICESNNGCSIDCSELNCDLSFHVSCGFSQDLCIEYRDGKKNKPGVVAAFCNDHTKLWNKQQQSGKFKIVARD